MKPTIRSAASTIALTAALAVSGIFIGSAVAQTGPVEEAPPTTQEAFAERGKARDARHQERLADALAPLVDAGVISSDQANAVIDALLDARPDRDGRFLSLIHI